MNRNKGSVVAVCVVCAIAASVVGGLSIAQASPWNTAASRNTGSVAQDLSATWAAMPAATAHALYAVVNPDGTLARGFGAVSSTSLGLGNYTVRFNEDVSGCAFDVTRGSAGAAGVPATGEESVAGEAASANGVLVHLADGAGNPATAGFHVIAVCGPLP